MTCLLGTWELTPLRIPRDKSEQHFTFVLRFSVVDRRALYVFPSRSAQCVGKSQFRTALAGDERGSRRSKRMQHFQNEDPDLPCRHEKFQDLQNFQAADA